MMMNGTMTHCGTPLLVFGSPTRWAPSPVAHLKGYLLGGRNPMLKWQGPILQIMFLKFPSWWFFTNPLLKKNMRKSKWTSSHLERKIIWTNPPLLCSMFIRIGVFFFWTKAPLQGSQILRAIGCTVLASRQEVTVKKTLNQMWRFF